MTHEEAIKCIKAFGLHHAIKDLPHSWKTVEAFNMAIEALEENESLAKSLNDAVELIHKLQKKNEWIPCSERLPEREGRYWVWADKEFVPDHADMPNSYKGSTEASFLNGHWYGNSIGKVYEWMPLPTPPKS